MNDRAIPAGGDADAAVGRKIAIVIAACALAWTLGATMSYRSGGINYAGLLPTTGCAIALWAAIRSDPRLMWFGTGVVVLSAVLLVFSVGLVVVPAALALIAGSIVLGRSPSS